MAIASFRHRGLRLFYEKNDPSKVLPEPASRKRIKNILGALDTAESISEMRRFPAWKVHELKGDRKGIWGATITGNWRITFSFKDGDAFDVDLEDYH